MCVELREPLRQDDGSAVPPISSFSARVTEIARKRVVAPGAIAIGGAFLVPAWALLSLAPKRRSRMSMTTLLIILVVVLLLGGGGFFFRRRG